MTDVRQICVAFDLDDTLFKEHDFVESGLSAVANAYSEMTGMSGEELLSLMNRSDDPFDALLALPVMKSVSIDDLLPVYRYHKPSLTLPSDSKCIIEYLKNNGVYVGIITDGRSETQWNKIKVLGLDRLINRDNIIVSDDIGADKTTILPFETMMQRCQARSYFYVGDNPSKDFYYPRRLGWTAVMLRDINVENIHIQDLSLFDADHAPDIIIDNLEELKNIVLPCQ